MAYAMVTSEGASLFIDQTKVSSEIEEEIKVIHDGSHQPKQAALPAFACFRAVSFCVLLR